MKNLSRQTDLCELETLLLMRGIQIGEMSRLGWLIGLVKHAKLTLYHSKPLHLWSSQDPQTGCSSEACSEFCWFPLLCPGRLSPRRVVLCFDAFDGNENPLMHFHVFVSLSNI
jgi:hypothetical protein